MIKILLLAGSLSSVALPTVPLFAQASSFPLTWKGTVDWQKQVFHLTIETPYNSVGPNIAAGPTQAEKQVQHALPRVLFSSVSPLQIDSQRTLGEEIRRSEALAAQLLSSISQGTPGVSRPGRSLSQLSVEYRFPLPEIFIKPLIPHTQPMDVPRIPQWVPSATFSGLVIYAKGDLPHYGEKRVSKLKPALFPELFMEPLDPVLLTSMAEPSYLARWGVAAYSPSFDERPYLERIGPTPLRIIATGVYGKYPTDLIISREDGYRILSRQENRRLLREGRVLIICDSVTEEVTDPNSRR